MESFLKTVFNFAVLGTCGAFFHELFVFPWAHNSYFGQEVMKGMSDTLVPSYNKVGSLFGYSPPLDPNVPIANVA